MATIAVLNLGLRFLVLIIADCFDESSHCQHLDGECIDVAETREQQLARHALLQVHTRDNRHIDTPGFEYVLGSAGSGTCPEGTDSVLDEAECTSYAEKRSWKMAGTDCYKAKHGCFNNTGNIYFSNCNYSTIDQHHSAVCRRLAVASTDMTHLTVEQTPPANSTAGANNTSVANASNTTNSTNATNSTTQANSTVTNATSNATGNATAVATEIQTTTVNLNWHRRRTSFTRRRHVACGSVGEDFTCPNRTTQKSDAFKVTQNASEICVEADPDKGWDFNVTFNCTKTVPVILKVAKTTDVGEAAKTTNKVEELFKLLDADGDGTITKKDFDTDFAK